MASGSYQSEETAPRVAEMEVAKHKTSIITCHAKPKKHVPTFRQPTLSHGTVTEPLARTKERRPQRPNRRPTETTQVTTP